MKRFGSMCPLRWHSNVVVFANLPRAPHTGQILQKNTQKISQPFREESPSKGHLNYILTMMSKKLYRNSGSNERPIRLKSSLTPRNVNLVSRSNIHSIWLINPSQRQRFVFISISIACNHWNRVIGATFRIERVKKSNKFHIKIRSKITKYRKM